jgi:hypothetical protein
MVLRSTLELEEQDCPKRDDYCLATWSRNVPFEMLISRPYCSRIAWVAVIAFSTPSWSATSVVLPISKTFLA